MTTQSGITASLARKKLMAVAHHGEVGSKIKSLTGVQDICSLLGIDNMDLFTYDQILFVEGPSDVGVFQRVLQHFDDSGQSDRTKIVELFGDGKLKKTTRALQLVNLLLSASTSQVHVPVKLLVDSNDWMPSAKQDLEKALNKDSKSEVRFLKRPELEDYLVHEEATAALLAADAEALPGTTTPSLEQVKQTLGSATSEKGSERLATCFRKLVPGHEFSKKRDSIRLEESILTLEPEFLRPLYEELISLVGGAR